MMDTAGCVHHKGEVSDFKTVLPCTSQRRKAFLVDCVPGDALGTCNYTRLQVAESAGRASTSHQTQNIKKPAVGCPRLFQGSWVTSGPRAHVVLLHCLSSPKRKGRLGKPRLTSLSILEGSHAQKPLGVLPCQKPELCHVIAATKEAGKTGTGNCVVKSVQGGCRADNHPVTNTDCYRLNVLLPPILYAEALFPNITVLGVSLL